MTAGSSVDGTSPTPQHGPSPAFSVIIVNYNGGDYLSAALESLKQQTCRDFEVILIDNASKDGSVDGLDLSGLPQARLIRNADNLGFAAANNQAAHLARGRWLALLNPDATAAPDWLEQLQRAFREFPGCRVFASTQYALEEDTLLDGTGDAYLIFGIPWRGGHGHSISRLPETGHCFSPCGAAAVYDRDLFLSLGGFDERFFCYCEDVDIGFRLQLEGEPCIFVRDAAIHHAGSAISGRYSFFSAYHGTRNRIWTYAKNMPAVLLLATLPAHVAISIYLILRSATLGCFKATLKGTWDGLAGLPEIVLEPRWKAPARKVSLWSLARSMAWNPLRLHRRKPHIRLLGTPTLTEELVAEPAG